MRNLIGQFFDLRDILIILKVVKNFKEPLEEQCSFSILPVGMLFHLYICRSKKLPVACKLGQGGSAPDQHVEVVQGGDGSGQVPLGCVQLLYVSCDLFHLYWSQRKKHRFGHK